MIKLARTRTAAAIAPVFTGSHRIKLNKKLLQTGLDIVKGTAQKHEWDSDVWGKSKAQLLKESSNKCAYCEAPLKAVAYGDVEHYRPKSVYWWLAYNYENYLASCTLCNQAFKKDHFPLAKEANRLPGPSITTAFTDADLKTLAPNINCDPLLETEGMALADFMQAHKNETALLINPYYDDPTTIFGYRADETLQEVEIFVQDSVQHAPLVQKAIVDDYGLNRLELRQLRFEWYDSYITFKMTLAENNISQALRTRIERKIERLKLPASPFAGMIQYFES